MLQTLQIEELRNIVRNYEYVELLKNKLKNAEKLKQFEGAKHFVGLSELYERHGEIYQKLSLENAPLEIDFDELLSPLNIGHNSVELEIHINQEIEKLQDNLAILNNLEKDINEFINQLDFLLGFNYIRVAEDTQKNFEENIQRSLQKIDEKREEIKLNIKKLEEKLPLEKQLLKYAEKSIISNLPEKYIKIRKLDTAGEKARTVFGIVTGGHLTMEVYDNTKNPKSIYISFVHTDQFLENNNIFNSITGKLHLPRDKTYEGAFNSLDLDTAGMGKYYKPDYQEVLIDCTEDCNVEFNDLYEKAKNVIGAEAPNYHFYNNNCTTFIYNIFKELDIPKKLDIPPAEVHLGRIMTPTDAIEFFERVNIKVATENYNNAIENKHKKINLTEKFKFSLKYLIGQVSALDFNLALQKQELDQTKINLPDFSTLEEKLRNSLEKYDINNAIPLLKLVQIVLIGLEQQARELQEKDQPIKLIEQLAQYVQFITNRLSMFNLDISQNDNSQTKKHKAILAKAREHLLKNTFSKSEIYFHLKENETKTSFLTLRNNLLKFDKTVLPSKQTNAAFETARLSDYVDSKKVIEKTDIETSNEEFLKRYENEEVNLQNQTELGNKVTELLKHCETIVDKDAFSQNDFKNSLSTKIINIKCAIEATQNMQKTDKQNEKIYHCFTAELRKLLGTFNQMLYFNLDEGFDIDAKNSDNLLSSLKNMQGYENDSANIQEYIRTSNKHVKTYGHKDYAKVISEEQLSIIKQAEQNQGKASDFKLPRQLFNFREYNACIEIKTRFQTKELLADNSISSVDKYKELNTLIKDQLPSKWNFFQREKRNRYLELAREVGMNCLLEDFTKGHLDEIKFLAEIYNLVKSYPLFENSKDDKLLQFAEQFKQKYVRILEDQGTFHKNKVCEITNISEKKEGPENSKNLNSPIKNAKDQLINSNKKYIETLQTMFGKNAIIKNTHFNAIQNSDNIEEHIDFAVKISPCA